VEIAAGEMLCVVGPNGAGKTTLLDVATGNLAPASGGVELCGAPLDLRGRTHLHDVGVVPDDASLLLDELTAGEYWRLIAAVHAPERAARDRILDEAARLAATLDFDPGGAPIATFSHGMRKKTQLVAALALRPRLLVVDELRNGLDPIAGHRTERLVREACAQGTAVLLAAHDLHWAERFATTVVVLARGSVRGVGPPTALLAPGERSLEEAFFRLVEASP
jgi:ABC-2 type transport system ATP-binding protein